MVLTNPGREAYESYAVEQLTSYLKESVCPEASQELGEFLQRQCSTLVDVGRPQIQQIISETTERQNLIFFSIYRTNLSVGSFSRAYKFETVGAFQTFFTYEAQQQ
ncbi:MAG: hypothetical protein BRC54_11875 [Cyanobacteria bacterium SW_7_48_12]|nr:MAG: hypothetical protein BRC54_11875 [Cyanobacteria bacterium SW_7_48_12]